MTDNTINNNPNVQHGIDNDPNNDAKKGAELGGIGGVVTGALAGSVAGPIGTVIGAVAGGIAGAVLSGAAVGAVDRIDDDNTVTGIGGTTVHRAERNADNAAVDVREGFHDAAGNIHNAAVNAKDDINAALPGNKVPGVQTGGHAIDGSGAADTRGITEKVADAVTGDRTDDKTGRPV